MCASPQPSSSPPPRPPPFAPPQDQEAPSGLDLVRCVATSRIVMPRTVVRLSAGRLDLTEADQALAFMAGANSIFDGDKLLTTPNNDRCALDGCVAPRALRVGCWRVRARARTRARGAPALGTPKPRGRLSSLTDTRPPRPRPIQTRAQE